jgi:branched-chain amino acid transport system ATP-binding protein
VDGRGIRLEIAGASVRFGGLQALDDVGLIVEPGTITGLIGPNGAGKTTLFNAVSGFVKIAAGSIRLDGRDVTRLPASERAPLGLVRTFQQVGLVRDATVLANALMAQHRLMRTGVFAGIAGLATSEERELASRAHEALSRLDIASLAPRRVRDLPHGLQKLAELACAIVRRPRLLLLDEPSAGLDPAETSDLGSRLRELQSWIGFTALVTDHDMRLVRAVAQHVCVLSFGRVLATGGWDDVRANADVIAAYLGAP